MSWQIFKQNILAVANRPDGIPDIDTVAKLYADEYDAAVKRGGDLLHGIPIQSGNKLIMEQLFKLALQKGLSSTGPYDLVGEMGNGVKAYWAGATMKRIGTRPGQPLPIVPPVPKVTLIETNIVTNNGIWIPPIPSLAQPTEEELDKQEAEALDADKEQNKKIEAEFDSLFDSKEAAESHNKLIPYTPDKSFEPPTQSDRIEDDYGSVSDLTNSNPPSIKGTPYTESSNGERYTDTSNPGKAASKGAAKKQKSSGTSYKKLKEEYGDGEYPALDVNGHFVIDYVDKYNSTRYWYKPNPSFAKKQYTYVIFPVGNGQSKFLIHKKIAPKVEEVAKLVKARKLQQYVQNIGGGLALRNNTTRPSDDTSLSFHAWGLAVDVNSDKYPYGVRFSCDFKQIFINGKWKDCNSDDIGFLKVAQCFIECGFGWLGNCSNKDAMHFSVEEGGYKGAIPV